MYYKQITNLRVTQIRRQILNLSLKLSLQLLQRLPTPRNQEQFVAVLQKESSDRKADTTTRTRENDAFRIRHRED